jgi:hypothetical protein
MTIFWFVLAYLVIGMLFGLVKLLYPHKVRRLSTWAYLRPIITWPLIVIGLLILFFTRGRK